MKNLAILVAVILFSCCVTSQVTARDRESSLGDEKFVWWWHYHYFPYFHPKPHWPIPTGKAFPPIPAGHFHPAPYHPPPEVAKCLSGCQEVRTCYAGIIKAFFTRKPALETDCCASIVKMTEDCEKTLFGYFNNPFFNCFVKLHCSNKSGSTPSAPSPA